MTADVHRRSASVGGLLPADLLARVVGRRQDLTGLAAGDYHLAAGETPREAANRAWAYLRGVWTAYRATLASAARGDPRRRADPGAVAAASARASSASAGVPTTPAGGLHVGDRAFPVSHAVGQRPRSTCSAGASTWTGAPRACAGAAERAPHAMVQELLNRTDDYLWALLSNGRHPAAAARLHHAWSARPTSSSTSRRSSTARCSPTSCCSTCSATQSRVEVRDRRRPAPATAGWNAGAPPPIEPAPARCNLLRDGVQAAIEALGTGFLRTRQRRPARRARRRRAHRSTTSTRRCCAWSTGCCSASSPRTATPARPGRRPAAAAALRDVLLHRPAAPPRAGAAAAPATATCGRPCRLVLDAPRPRGRPARARPARPRRPVRPRRRWTSLTGLPSCANEALLTAVRHLSRRAAQGRRPQRTVDYRNLGAEELGSIYESLLELVPRYDPVEPDLHARDARRATSARPPAPTTRPPSLIDLVLDTALDPVLDDAEKRRDPEAGAARVTVCDPACGSGHFLVAAARRIANRLAAARTGDAEPDPRRDVQAGHARRRRPLHLRRRRQPDGRRTGQGQPLAGSPGARPAADLPRRAHQGRQRPARHHARAARRRHPRRRVHAARRRRQGRRRALRKQNRAERAPDQDSLFDGSTRRR